MSLTIGSLFSGIGGLELGIERATGARTIWQVEADPFCRRVLAKHWPEAIRHDDVRTASALPAVDILCGGFPCQDISLAGKGAGIEHGAKSGLWREFARIIGEQPAPKPVVVIENVAAIAGRGLARVLRDLADLGYLGVWDVVTAASVGAPHLRRRLFVVAAHADSLDLRLVAERRSGGRAGELCRGGEGVAGHAGAAGPPANADRDGCERRQECDLVEATGGEVQQRDDADGCLVARDASDADCNLCDEGRAHPASEGPRGRDVDRGVVGDAHADGAGREEQHAPALAARAGLGAGSPDEGWCGWLASSAVRRMDDGLPEGVDRPRRRRRPSNDRHRLHALGNAVVPQVAEVVGRAVAQALGARSHV